MQDGSLQSKLLARDYKFFEAARKAACGSDFKVKVGAVAVWKRRIIASAYSSSKTETMQFQYNKYRKFNQTGLCLPKVHAEVALVKKVLKLDINPKDIEIYVYRVCKSREKGIARPCNACLAALRDAGITVIKYTTDFGYSCELIEHREA